MIATPAPNPVDVFYGLLLVVWSAWASWMWADFLVELYLGRPEDR